MDFDTRKKSLRYRVGHYMVEHADSIGLTMYSICLLVAVGSVVTGHPQTGTALGVLAIALVISTPA